MPTPVIVYPLDLTGSASSNLVTGELHDLSGLPANQNRAFVLNYGPFYANSSLVVRRNDTNEVLTPKTINNPNGQYVATQLLPDATLQTGKTICAVIVITDLTLPAGLTVSVDAQMLGGDYSASVTAIQQLIDALDLGQQPVTWASILGKPVLFPPAPHLHDLGDVYGFEYIVAALERITQAIYIGDDAQHAAIYQYIDHQIGGFNAQLAAVNQALSAHLADFTNPHHVTAAQVGLGNVQNYGLATTAQAQAGTATNAYMTPALTLACITTANAPLTAHLTDYNNPHQTTAAQVGLGNVQNYGIASTAQAQAGTATNLYMTPALVAAAVTTQALGPLNAHIANTSNPHSVTAAQVGLGNVQNYGIATTGDAQAGVSTSSYMTPALTAAAIQYQVGATLTAHINNFSNPHNVTKAQVGLGNADNTSDLNKPISTATQAALNAKASLNANVQFTGVYLSTNQDVLIYESAAGVLAFRTGTAGGGYRYTTIDASGNLSVPGRTTSTGGFQPSDERLKDNPTSIEPRALWRELSYYGWDWKSGVPFVGKGRGVLAGEAKKAGLTEYLAPYQYMVDPGDPEKGVEPTMSETFDTVDYANMGFEMIMAAGREIDRLRGELEALRAEVAAYHNRLGG